MGLLLLFRPESEDVLAHHRESLRDGDRWEKAAQLYVSDGCARARAD